MVQWYLFVIPIFGLSHAMTSMTADQVWQAALGELELTLSKANFTTWFKNTCIAEISSDRVTISVPNLFTKDWFEKKYHGALQKTLQHILNAPIREVAYKIEHRRPGALPLQATTLYGSVNVAPEAGQQKTVAATGPAPRIPALNEYGLRVNYTFPRFIVGKGSELAYAAARAVVDNPGQKYNPLFIYGGVGLGKTHLLHAIGNEMVAREPRSKILYATCEQFTNEFINAVRSGQGKDFRGRYRNVDLLIIDDIQFITGKEGTQEEFFHTFNTLHQANKQVVLSSDRPPKAIPGLESRLLSRFEWGMMADVQPPDLETRIAILKTKCVELGIDITGPVLQEIASLIHSNVRELEGALTKIIGMLQLRNLQPTVESTREILAGFSASLAKKSLTPRQVLQTVSTYFDVRPEELVGISRVKRLAHPRQIAAFLLREEVHCSFPSIGETLGGRDHTTAMHACTKIAASLVTDMKLKQDLETIKEQLYS